MKSLVFITLSIFMSAAQAATFIGNGGNAGDVEREVSKLQLIGGLNAIIKSKTEDLCQCHPTYETNEICQSLQSLNQEQRTFCGRVLKVTAEQVVQTLQSQKVRYSWTNESIKVKEGESLRTVDAVTDVKQHKMTIHLNRFLDMNASQRVYLLGHEAYHLVEYQGRHFGDEGEIGPFNSPDGQRQLLNAMSASIVMATYKADLFKKYQATLSRPKNWKRHRVEFDVQGVSVGGDPKGTYSNDSFSGGELLYRYQSGSPWGITAAIKQYNSEQTILGTIDVQETLQGVGVGVSYRLFPFDDPLSFLGQSHMIFDLQLEYFEATSEISEGSLLNLKNTTTAPGVSLDCKYYIPLELNIWLYLGVGAEQLNYEFKSIGVKYDSLRTRAILGVSYGF